MAACHKGVMRQLKSSGHVERLIEMMEVIGSYHKLFRALHESIQNMGIQLMLYLSYWGSKEMIGMTLTVDSWAELNADAINPAGLS